MKKEIVFLTAQKSTWPLINALQKSNPKISSLIPYYNQTFKYDSDFLPVKLELSDSNGLNSQAEIALHLQNQINLNKPLPEIILADEWSANILIKNKLAFNFNNSNLKASLFLNPIVKLLNPEISSGFFNLPFNVADINAPRVNLDILYLFFKILKDGGAQISFKNKIYNKSQKSFNPNKNAIKNNILNFVKPANSKVFEHILIKDNFLEVTEELMWICNEFVKGLLPIEEKIHLLNDSVVDLNIFVWDYSEKNLIKLFLSKTKIKNNWYNYENREKLIILLKEVKQNFCFTIKNNEYSKNICAIKFLKTYQNQWGNYELLQYRSIFGLVTGVGLRYAVDSYFTRKYFASEGQDKEKISNFTSYKNIETLNQTVFESCSSFQKPTYLLGGSSIIVRVSKDPQVHKATIKFLNWLYTGEIKVNKITMSTQEFLNKHSGYFIPFNNIFENQNLKSKNKKSLKLFAKIKKYEQNKGISNTNEFFGTINWETYLDYFNLKTVISSLKSLQKINYFLKSNDNKPILLTSGHNNFYEYELTKLIYNFLVSENLDLNLLEKIKNY